MSGYEPGCWRIYYGCTVCGSYTNIPWKRKLALTDGDTVDGLWELYLVRPDRYKCQRCKSWVFDSSVTAPRARLGESYNVIFCRVDQIKLLTKDDVAWLTDPATIVPFMACANRDLSIPFSLSDHGVSRNDRTAPKHKYRGFLHDSV